MAEEQPGEFKDVFSPIDKMYKILADARSGFMDQDLVKVSRSSLENLLDELKQALPTQLKSAVELMRNADAQMSQALAEAQMTTRKAETQAERIVAEAQKRADDLKASSQRWCLDNLQSLVETLRKLESTTQGGIENIKFRQKQDMNQKNGGK